MDWFTPSIGLLGVAIGALLTPYVTSRMENARAKRALKPQLNKAIWNFFNIRKTLIQFNTASGINTCTLNFIWDALGEQTLAEDIRRRFEKQHEIKITAILKDTENINVYHKMLIDIESELMALLAQVQTYYGQKYYDEIKTALAPHLKESNKGNSLADFHTMSLDDVNKLEQNLSITANEKFNRMDSDCDHIIGIISKTL